MAYGVTAQGFIRPRLPEIREEIIEDLRARLRAQGLPDNFETRPDSVTGVLIDTFADRETALWEMGEGVYYAMYPGSAYGVQLDRSVSFTGVTRQLAEPSRAIAIAYGLEGTVVPQAAQVRHRSTQTIWETAAPVTISAATASDVSISPTAVPGATYTVTVDGTPYSYTALTPTSTNAILAGLVAALSTSGLNVSSNGAVLRLILTDALSMSVTLSANLDFTEIGSTIELTAADGSAEEAAPGDLNTIVTLIDGWTAVNNLQAASPGRSLETDAELQARYNTGLFRTGAGTLPAILVNVRDNVAGVSAAEVLENDTDFVDANGNLPHSIQVIVEGGLQNEIAAEIYRVKGAGIDTNGAIVTVLNTTEGEQTILFDRPGYIYVWARAEITLLPSSEEAFPSNGFDTIRQAIADTGVMHGIGQDVILQRFYCAIYQTPGLAEVDLTFASSTNPAFSPAPGDYTAANITIAPDQMAKFDISRVEVS